MKSAIVVMVGLALLTSSARVHAQIADVPVKPLTTFKEPAFEAWAKGVASLPADKQAAAVARKLVELNSGFDGKATHVINGRLVTEFAFVSDDVTDISPVRALAGLRRLDCSGSIHGKHALNDLSPLEGMTLTSLECSFTRVSDLTPLHGTPLTHLDCSWTDVADLSPLRGMKLVSLNCGAKNVSDLSPLKGMPLTELSCHGTSIADLSALKGMPLAILNCNDTTISDLSPLQGMPLKRLSCGSTLIDDLAPIAGMQLTDLYCGFTKIANLKPLKNMPLNRLNCGDTSVSDLSPVRGMPLKTLLCPKTSISDLSPLADLPLAELDCRWTKVADLSPLKSTPLAILDCSDTKITSLAQLEGMRLTQLHFGGSHSEVSDLSPLHGMPLTDLSCFFAKRISDLSPLKGMKLTRLEVSCTSVSDLSPLQGMPLSSLGCSPTGVSDLSPLRGLPLTTLRCSETKISSLSPLEGMPLQSLMCRETLVSDLSPLTQMSTLTELYVRQTNVTPDSVAALKKALPDCGISWDAPAEQVCMALADDARQAQEDDIRDAVFRQQFSDHGNEGIFFLGVACKEKKKVVDPSSEFMKRFVDPKLTVLKSSAAGKNDIREVVERRSGKKGIHLYVGEIKLDSDTEATVEGGHYMNPLNASGNVYQLKKDDRGWKVIKTTQRWVS